MDKPVNPLALRRNTQILNAAKICFSSNGFHNTSMADICRETALSAGQIYRYFPSKSAIVSECIRDVLHHWREFLSEHLPLQKSTDDIINIHSAFWAGWPDKERKLMIEIYSEASRNDEIRNILAQEEQALVTELSKSFAKIKTKDSKWPDSYRIHFLLLMIDGVICRPFTDESTDENESARVNSIFTRNLF